ncbi:MAG: hypothetical protein NZ519_07045 [Bacteroidia bacterium]|nr:hypothetical protein [Bacteroidia bacterium]MDW8301328.1 hypothetical protein [Bacteroidia bacterium]
MKLFAAKCISFIALPVWLPFFISLILQQGMFWAILSALLILSFIIFYKKIGWLTSLHLSTRAERLLPLATSVIVYLTFSFLCQWHLSQMYQVFLLATLTVSSLYLATLWDKISIHTAGIAASLMWINEYYSWQWASVMIATLVLAAVIWARLYLKAHNLKQIIMGFGIGTASYMMLYLVKPFLY